MFDISDIIITSLENVIIVPSYRGRTLEMVNRHNFGLSFCIEGSITYTHLGKKYVSDKNHAVILPKGASYSLYGNEKGNFPLINFQCENLNLDTFKVVTLHNPESYIKEFENMKDRLLIQNSRPKAMSLFYDILYRLSNEFAETDNTLFPATNYLENNFSDPLISNTLLADKCNISEVYFRRLFKKRFGLSPKQYVLELRIRKAKQLLLDGNIPVTKVSELCGFTNPYHFSRAFHKITGLSPTQYKKENKLIII